MLDITCKYKYGVGNNLGQLVISRTQNVVAQPKRLWEGGVCGSGKYRTVGNAGDARAHMTGLANQPTLTYTNSSTSCIMWHFLVIDRYMQ